jgi:protein-S-isoprenylcysteine O-methyltransferase Ste14
MALREEFERTGNWLFRWRSYIPLVLIVPMLLAMQHPDYLRQDRSGQDAWALLCLAVSLVGLGIRVATVGHVPRGTSGRNTHEGQVAEVLNTSGVYSVVRHPLYLGNFVIWIGISMFCGIWWLTALFALGFWIYYERIMFAEEEFLRRKFGEAYVAWAEGTPAFFPRLRGWKRPELPFSLRTVLRREYPGLLAICASFFALEAYQRVVIQGQWRPNPLWTGIFLAGLAAFLTLRTLKRNTKLLVVDGR